MSSIFIYISFFAIFRPVSCSDGKRRGKRGKYDKRECARGCTAVKVIKPSLPGFNDIPTVGNACLITSNPIATNGLMDAHTSLSAMLWRIFIEVMR